MTLSLPSKLTSSPSLEITGSRLFINWLHQQKLSLAFSTYQSNRLFLLGIKNNGHLSAFAREFERVMGLFATPERIFLASRYQIWQLDNALSPGRVRNGYDQVFVPRIGHTTGELDVHDLAVNDSQEVVFVNTLYSCLATLSDRHSFNPIWRPKFISKLAPEDRCHLNGLAMVGGKPTYVTTSSQADVADGWRDHRKDGGCVIDIATKEVILSGLSMPHSPRFYQGKLWLLNSGAGEFGYVDLQAGKFEPVTFCPGYVRGLAFWSNFAIVGVSKPRDKSFTGLALEDKLAQKQAAARCGLLVIDLNSGNIIHWLRVEGTVTELYDVQVLPGVRCPMALGFKTDEIRYLLTFDSDGDQKD